MIPLAVLLGVFAIASLMSRRHDTLGRRGRIALAAMFVVTGTAHFTKTAELAAMLPPLIPSAEGVVYLTGIAELVIAGALILRRPPAWIGGVIVFFLLLLLPANIYSALVGTGLGAHGAHYLWFRIPLQLFFIAWTVVFTSSWHASSIATAR